MNSFCFRALGIDNHLYGLVGNFMWINKVLLNFVGFAVVLGLLQAYSSQGNSSNQVQGLLPDDMEPHLSGEPRSRVVLDDFLVDGVQEHPRVDLSYFQPVAPFQPAKHQFNGLLSVKETILWSSPWPSVFEPSTGMQYFPGFDVDFKQVGDTIIPQQRRLHSSTGKKSSWRLVISPGEVWHEPADGHAWSRGSFSILVIDKFGLAIEGQATFLFNDSQVTSLRVQLEKGFYGQVPTRFSSVDSLSAASTTAAL